MLVKQIPRKPGIYSLIIEKCCSEEIKIGKLGTFHFPRGCYCYTGSALGKNQFNLQKRLNRHLRPKRKSYWHIDYFLQSEETKIKQIILAETSNPLECKIAEEIEKIPGVKIIAQGFGSSDCKNRCKTHLHYFKNNYQNKIVKQLSQVYNNLGLKPFILIP